MNRIRQSFLKDEPFFISALLAVILIRSSIFLSRYFMPERHLVVGGYLIHHFWFGYPFLLVGLFLSLRQKVTRQVLLGIGTGILPTSSYSCFMAEADMRATGPLILCVG